MRSLLDDLLPHNLVHFKGATDDLERADAPQPLSYAYQYMALEGLQSPAEISMRVVAPTLTPRFRAQLETHDGALTETAEPAPAEGARPLALVTCSTEFQDDGRLIEVALEALADEDLEVVATTAAVDPSRFRAPPNARVVRYAPHGPLLRRAEVVICHGGMGITQKALAAGVPVCVVPFGRDQLDVARHVEVAGAGARVAPARLTAPRLREAVALARSRRAGAQRVAQGFADAGGAAACVSALEALVPGA